MNHRQLELGGYHHQMVSCASIRLPMRATRSTSEEPTIAQSPTSLGTMRGIVPHVCAAGRARLGGGLRTGARLGGGFRAAAAAFSRCRSRARSRTVIHAGSEPDPLTGGRSATWPLPRVERFGSGAAVGGGFRAAAAAFSRCRSRARSRTRSATWPLPPQHWALESEALKREQKKRAHNHRYD